MTRVVVVDEPRVVHELVVCRCILHRRKYSVNEIYDIPPANSIQTDADLILIDQLPLTVQKRAWFLLE